MRAASPKVTGLTVTGLTTTSMSTARGGHGSVKSYLTGFVLSVILTVIRSGW